MKNIGVFVSKNFPFLEVKFSIYLNRSVFVMVRRIDKPSEELPFSNSFAPFCKRVYLKMKYMLPMGEKTF